MPNQQFTALTIEFSESDKASVYYAHLQNVFKQLYSNHIEKKYQTENVLLQKIDQVLYDIFFQYQNLQREHFSTSKSLKNMLAQCSTLINQCKDDREQLVKVTQDRQYILQKLKQSTNQSLQIVQQNQKLYEHLDKLKQLNLLLTQKNSVLQDQIKNTMTSAQGYQNVITLSKEFQRISHNNSQIQNDIVDILKTTEIYANASEPLQIMCLAFDQNPLLRDTLWNAAIEKHKNKFENVEGTKDNFFKFNYIDALMLFSTKSQ